MGSLEFCKGDEAENTRVMPLRPDDTSLTIYGFVQTQYDNVTDGQTDGRSWQNHIALCILCMLTRGRNYVTDCIRVLESSGKVLEFQ